MTRQREIPSVLYRSPNLVHVTYPQVAGVPKIRFNGSARLNDAYGNVAGVAGGGTTALFEVGSGESFRSPSIRARRFSYDESTRGRTTAIWDPDDYATPAQAPGTNYLPTDEQTLFVRVQQYSVGAGGYANEGPILVIPPYDFFTTGTPVFTVSGKAPNLGIGAFPPNIPDTMTGDFLSFLVPSYSATFSLANLDSLLPIFFSCHPGMPPSVVGPNQEVTLTGAGVPDVFVACPNGNPWFTLRVAVVNSGG